MLNGIRTAQGRPTQERQRSTTRGIGELTEQSPHRHVQHHGLLLPAMIKTLVLFQLIAASAAVPGQVDIACRAYCQVLVVQGGIVKFLDQAPHSPRTVILGNYAPAAQRLVPRTEAPVRDLRSSGGWRVVVSIYLNHDDDDFLAHVRFFAPDGRLRVTDDALEYLEETRIGTLFGGDDEIFAMTSNEEHAYNTQSDIWVLPKRGDPKVILEIQGIFATITGGDDGRKPGVTVARQTFDGVHAETKGAIREFYAWNRETKSLVLQKK
jgi:hypothetical protein